MGRLGRILARLADGAGLRDPSAPRPYDARDRLEQLRRCERLGAELADLFARHDRPPAAYRDLADEARRLLAQGGGSSEELRALARLLPPAPGWMNPKAIDSGLAVDPWQLDAAEVRTALVDVVLELRATARYGNAP